MSATPPKRRRGQEIPVDLTSGTPKEIWNQYFRDEKRDPAVVGDAIHELFARREYDQVIAAIQAALLHGQSQPWMYQVLALTMEIVGKPKAEVERVLLSTLDFTAVDIPSMLYSAAMLTRFGGDDQALQLYRQSSRIDPTRAEPYLLGLKLARKLKDPDAIEWAASGILQYAWTDDFERLHHQAQDAALNAEQMLRQEGETDRAQQLKDSIQEARKRDLVIRLTWSGEGDLDLSVEEPTGSICSFMKPRTEAGGIFLRDGHGPQQDNCFEEYLCPLAMPGYYQVRVKHIAGNIVGKRAQLTITRYQGTPEEVVRTRSVQFDKPEKVLRISLHQGRRKETSAVPNRQTSRLGRPSPVAPLRGSVRVSDPDGAAVAREFEESRRRAVMGQFVMGAVGYQPVVSLVGEGVSLNGSVVVSPDRRYVRMAISPTISSLVDVFTFSYVSTGP